VNAIKEISVTIEKLSEISSTIAAAVEEQGAATQEISRNVQQAAQGTQQVSSNITDVQRGAGETGSPLRRFSPRRNLCPATLTASSSRLASSSTRYAPLEQVIRLSLKRRLDRDDFSSNRHPAQSFCLSMISAQTRSAFVAKENRIHFSGSCSIASGRIHRDRLNRPPEPDRKCCDRP